MTDTTEPTLLTIEEVRAARREREEAAAVEATSQYEYVRPLSAAANGLIEYLQNPEGRLMFGMHKLDAMTRGFGRGELVYVTGHSHSGKTQVILNAIVNNLDRRWLIFTPDEPAELVLSKLVAIVKGINSEHIEERIRDKDPAIVDMVRTVASRDLRNVIVIDTPLSWENMRRALEEARDALGGVDVCVFDFLEQLPGGSEDGGGGEAVTAKSLAVKRWIKMAEVVGLVIHQRGRNAGDRGKPGGIAAMRYGGENDAIFVLEVFRKRDDESLDPFERKAVENDVTINLCKNKRPPGKIGMVDMHMDSQTGKIREKVDLDDAAPTTGARGAWMQRQGMA